MMKIRKFWQIVNRARDEESGLAAVEFALIFPLMMSLLMGVYDLGFGVLAAQKTVRASQVTADLIARHKDVNDTEIFEAIRAGELSMLPFSENGLEYDIVSVEYDESGDVMTPPIWRCTSDGLTADNEYTTDLSGFGLSGNGVVRVYTQYTYNPIFYGFLFDQFVFEEIAYVSGRLSPTVDHEFGAATCAQV